MTEGPVLTNEVVSEMPPLDGDCYVALAPKWFTFLLRFFTGSFTAMVTWFTVRGWSGIPLGFQILLCILLPTFFFMALHPKGWASFSIKPFFVANELGMYFPSHRKYVVGAPNRNDWLLVPWENISNIRLDEFSGYESMTECAAFDVRASVKEVKRYFIGTLDRRPESRLRVIDLETPTSKVSVAFYTHRPPHPRKVVIAVLGFAERHNKLRKQSSFN